ncbi:MAG: ethylbenzene dehydrogenase [Chloroflexi bacterium]|nr:ethylbenzene dehydrogenase [Chloroflexota bacterium]
MKKLMYIVSLFVLVSMLLSACAPKATPTAVATEPPAPTEPPVPAWTAPEGALVSFPSATAPTLDGVGDEAAWADADEVVITVAGGANGFTTDVHIKTIYTADSIYFLVSYADSTESWFRSPWQMQADGTWMKINDPNDLGGDNNLVYEDKMAFIWPINNSIANFESVGCFIACHAGEEGKPYGNKYTASEGELGDIWHWKSIRNLNQIDDQYLDWTRYNAETAKEAGRKSDPKESGGYSDNYGTKPDPADATKTVADKTIPGFSSPSTDLATGAPGYILASEKVPFDAAAFNPGDYIPGIVKSEMVGDRGNISAGWKYADGTWTLEFGRLLDTGSEFDVQFTDLSAMYYFSVAVFDNAQVRHAFETGVSFLVFKP